MTTNTYPLNNWYNVTWTKSANVWSIYVNGSLDVSSALGNGTTPFSNNIMWLGGLYQPPEIYYYSSNIGIGWGIGYGNNMFVSVVNGDNLWIGPAAGSTP